ncbi:MAG: hypothetical protein BWY72_02407 [Bacteroidetes bacterium ADurb.Bin416]|nr:MAG: hypothetical protein BWY72_02407 [Bacteroidetes bacterium ADurb.Bin416]
MDIEFETFAPLMIPKTVEPWYVTLAAAIILNPWAWEVVGGSIGAWICPARNTLPSFISTAFGSNSP